MHDNRSVRVNANASPSIAARCRQTWHGAVVTACAILFAAVWAAAADTDWLRQAAARQPAVFNGTNLEKPADTSRDIRGKVTIRRLKTECKSDWNNDPTALPYFVYQVSERTRGKFPIYVNNEGLAITSPEIFDYPIIYFTSHYAFQFSDDEVEMLKKYLARGGTLWLDDCACNGPYMDCVPANVQRIIPGVELKLMVKEAKAFGDLFSLLYTLEETPTSGNTRSPFQCAYLNGRPAIQVCPNDFGCGWEVSTPPTALSPLGGNAHGDTTPTAQKNRELIYQFSVNWLFYALTH